MSKEKTIYCGSGKKQNDNWIKVTINPDKIKNYIETYEGNKFIRLNINVKPDPDQYGKDVSVSVDTWKPDTSKQSGTRSNGDNWKSNSNNEPDQNTGDIDDDFEDLDEDIPF